MAFGAVERLIALRYLRARRDEGFLSIIAGFSLVGIALGVGTLIVVMAVMNGFRVEMLRQITAMNGHIGVAAGPGGIANSDAVERRIREVPFVESTSAILESYAMLAVADQVRGVMVRGMRLADMMSRPPIRDSVNATARFAASGGGCGPVVPLAGGAVANRGDLATLGRERAVAIGLRMAERLGLKVGDTLTLVSSRTVDTPLGRLQFSRRFAVGAIYEVGMEDYDANFVYMTIDNARDFFGTPGRTTMIEVFGRDAGSYQAIVPAINAALEYRYNAFDWVQANSSFFATIQAQTSVMFLVLTMIVLVAAFNIVSSLMMLVRLKGADIAVLRTLGARRGAILRIFLMDGMGIGVVGTGAGALLGLLFAGNIESVRQWLQSTFGLCLFDPQLYQLSELPARISGVEVAVIVTMALLFAFLATLYPAWAATRVDPVEGLRRG